MRCRVISMSPNCEMRRIFVRARSRRSASRSASSTLRRCVSLRMSMKSLTITPPRSRSRSCRAISLAACRFIWYAVSSALLSARKLPLFTSMATSASVCSMTSDPPSGISIRFWWILAISSSIAVLVEQRLGVVEVADAAGELRHDDLEELAGVRERGRLVHPDGVDVVGEDVADGPRDHVRLRGRSRPAPATRLIRLTTTCQSRRRYARSFCSSVASRSMAAVRTMNPTPFGGLERGHDLAEPAAGVVVLDLARHADAVQARHQHEVAAGDADVGAESVGPFVPTLP